MNEKNVLLIEDNPDDIELTMMAFKKYNIMDRLIVLNSGREALDYLFGTGAYTQPNLPEIPQLILLDLNLPKINGLEVLRQIRTNQRTKLIPVVILTSSKEEQDRLQSYSLNANSYIRKPVNFDQFIEAVKQLGRYWLVLNQPPPTIGFGD